MKRARGRRRRARAIFESGQREREIGPARTPAGLSGLHIRAARDVVALFSTRLVLSATYPRPTLGLFFTFDSLPMPVAPPPHSPPVLSDCARTYSERRLNLLSVSAHPFRRATLYK